MVNRAAFDNTNPEPWGTDCVIVIAVDQIDNPTSTTSSGYNQWPRGHAFARTCVPAVGSCERSAGPVRSYDL